MSSFFGIARIGDEASTPARDIGDPAQDRARSAFIGCVERLEQLIERENEALKSLGPFDFEDFNIRKAHALLEFSRASRSVFARGSSAIESRLARLRASLAKNNSLLDQHLQAMREISGIMIKTIEMAESDGTYSNRFFVDR